MFNVATGPPKCCTVRIRPGRGIPWDSPPKVQFVRSGFAVELMKSTFQLVPEKLKLRPVGVSTRFVMVNVARQGATKAIAANASDAAAEKALDFIGGSGVLNAAQRDPLPALTQA